MIIPHHFLTENEFDAQFPLIANHLNPHAGWTGDNGRGCLFETFGAEFDFVRQQDPRCVWTLLDTDEGALVLASGCHFVNRLGYLVSTVPVPDEVSLEVLIDQPTDEERTFSL